MIKNIELGWKFALSMIVAVIFDYFVINPVDAGLYLVSCLFGIAIVVVVIYYYKFRTSPFIGIYTGRLP